ncbi:hypothetical protein vBBceHLY2_00159 [Bacillus phage vB_BceH_LY2]|nr:hypothetical protein vBBceHLY2_00159 [Bacillus phage vB_BceH_LY2]
MTIGGKFFEELRELILRKSGLMARLVPHYENLLDWQDQLATLLVDTEEYKFSISYSEDDTNGYSDGCFSVPIHSTNRHYEIKLFSEDRMTGYCMCKPSEEGYDEEHECTGVNCDWYAPSFEVELITHIGNGSFNGNQRDMWKKEREWEGALTEFKERKARDKVKTKLEHAKQYMDTARKLQEEAKEILKEIEQGK